MAWRTPFYPGEERDIDFDGRNALQVGKLNFADATTLVISNGTISISQSVHIIDTEGGASTDDLETINGGEGSDVLYLRIADSTRTVVIKHNTGNIVTPNGSDYTMDSTDDVVQLIYDGTNWHVVGSVGGGTESSSTFVGLADTPSSYTGYAGYSPIVNSGETALEWQSFADMELVSRIIYVDADSGSDTTGDGSSSNPYQTYSKALSEVRNVIGDGVTITIHLNAATNTYTPVDTGRLCIGTGNLVIEGELSSLDSGTATGGSATTIQDTSKSWTTDAHKGKLVKITVSGTDYYRLILSNTSDTLTVVGRLPVTPSSGNAYTIYDWGTVVDGTWVLSQGNITIQDLRFQVSGGHGIKVTGDVTLNLLRCEGLSQGDGVIPVRFESGIINATIDTVHINGQGHKYHAIVPGEPLKVVMVLKRSLVRNFSSGQLIEGARYSYYLIRDGTVLDGNIYGVKLQQKAMVGFYGPTVNGASDKVSIKNCSSYGIYLESDSCATETSYVSFSGNGTDIGTDSGTGSFYA